MIFDEQVVVEVMENDLCGEMSCLFAVEIPEHKRAVIFAFLASDVDELLVEGENHSLTVYYLNMMILEKDLEGVLGVDVASGSCYLRRLCK